MNSKMTCLCSPGIQDQPLNLLQYAANSSFSAMHHQGHNEFKFVSEITYKLSAIFDFLLNIVVMNT